MNLNLRGYTGSYRGTEGNDILDGQQSSLTIIEGLGGDDIIYGGTGFIGSYVVPTSLYGNDGNDFIYGSAQAPNNMYGGNGNDILIGGNSRDNLFGGNGEDFLYGSKGNDVLWGGYGADTFYFRSKFEGIDIIKDFNRQQRDKILIDKISFGATSLNEFSYNSNTGGLFFQGTQFAVIETKPSTLLIDVGISF